MPRIVVETQYDAAPEQVFAVLTDLGNVAQRVSGIEHIEILSQGPIGVGSRWRETRTFGRHTAEEEMEFIEYEPGKSFAVRCDSHGTRYLTRYVMQAEGNSTRVVVDFDAKAVSLTAKLLSPLGRIMLGSVAKCLRQDLDELRPVIEKDTSIPADAIPA